MKRYVLLMLLLGTRVMSESIENIFEDRLNISFQDLNSLWKSPADAPFPILTVDKMHSLSDQEQNELRCAVDRCGLFYLRLDDADWELVGSVWEKTQRFFAQPEKEKRNYLKKDYGGGYTPLAVESTARPTGVPGGKDLCEKYAFRLGWTPLFPNKQMHLAWEQWAKRLSYFTQEVVVFLGNLYGVSEEKVSCWARATKNVGFVRFHRYPDAPSGEREETLRMADHRDITLCSLGFQTPSKNGFVSLEVLCDNKWQPVPPIKHTMVMFVGEFLRYLTHGVAQPASHRVVLPPAGQREGSARESIIFFGYPDSTIRFKTLPGPYFKHVHEAAQDKLITHREFVALMVKGHSF